MHLPLAFSIHNFVTSVGADAGFAAIVGLAILVLLYFAQARETSTLRDESVAASQRVSELERRLSQLGRPGAAARPQPTEAVVAGFRLAPAGVGAPALLSATRLIPISAAAAAPPKAPAPAPARRPVASPQPAGPAPAPAREVIPTPRPATAAAAAQAPAAQAPAPVAAEVPSPAATNGTGEQAAVPPAPPKPPARPLRRSAQQSRLLSTPPSRRTTRGRLARFAPAILIALLAAAGVVALLIVTSAGGSSRKPAASKTTNAPSTRAAAGIAPSAVTVSVLNGTDVFQLAHRVGVKLQRAGYHEAAVATASDQTHTTTIVGYLTGHRPAAVKVASALGLPATSVQQADQSAQAVACPPPSACAADVIVTVGRDLSNTP